MGKAGRKRSLDVEQASSVRWYYEKTDNSMEALARRFRVSQTVIKRVIDRKGPYANDPPDNWR